jgi:hypothetical protein
VVVEGRKKPHLLEAIAKRPMVVVLETQQLMTMAWACWEILGPLIVVGMGQLRDLPGEWAQLRQ